MLPHRDTVDAGVYTRVSSFREWLQIRLGPEPPALPPSSPVPPLPPNPPAPPPSPPSPPISPPPSPCDCSVDGISGGWQTGRAGCADHLSDGEPFCYVFAPAQCDTASSSSAFPGSAWRFCTDPPSPPPPLPRRLGLLGGVGLLCDNSCADSIYASDGDCDE